MTTMSATVTDRRPILVLAVLSLLVCGLSVWNAGLIFDDLTLPGYFRDLQKSFGPLGVIGAVFRGEGMPAEYRTYGVSRVVQYALWSTFGSSAAVYAIWIATTQGLASIALYQFLSRRCNSVLALALAVFWLCSPFSATGCFHHYSYLILPYQVMIFLLLYGERINATDGRLRPVDALTAILGGIVVALTGEAHLVVAIALLVMALFSTRSKALRRWLFLVTLSAVIALALHFLLWRFTVFVPTAIQRFDLNKMQVVSPTLVANRLWLLLQSLWTGITTQIGYLATHSRVVLVPAIAFIGLLTYFVFLRRSTGRFEHETARNENSVSEHIERSGKIRVPLLVVSVASLAVYLILIVATGDLYEIFPRRYGYVPYTLFCMSLLAILLPLRRNTCLDVGITALLAVYLGLFLSLRLEVLTRVRREDAAVTRQVISAQATCGTCFVLFPLSTITLHKNVKVDWWTPGLRGGGMAADLIESPYVAYWVQSYYMKYVLGNDRFGHPGRINNNGQIEVLDLEERPIESSVANVKIIANVLSAPEGGTVSGVRRFDSWAEYTSDINEITIKQGIDLSASLAPASNVTASIAIDLGRASASFSPGVYRDKIYAEPNVAKPDPGSSLVDYGLFAGANSIYAVANEANPGYYISNRNSNFTYRLDFRATTAMQATVALDFWEIWKRKPGERVFALDVKLDDRPWKEIMRIDPAAIGGDRPFAIELGLTPPATMLLRFRKLDGSIDVPFIQGIRVATSTR